jgi:phosphohistidine phosphatase SixA
MGLLAPRAEPPWTRILIALATAAVGLGLFLARASSSSPVTSASHASRAPSAPSVDSPALAPAETKVDCTTVVFVRHAEKDPGADPKDGDPGLGDAGRKRAGALARLLSHAGVTRLIASEYRRAQETLAPLAQSTGRKVEVVRASEPARLIDALCAAPSGSVTVVAGHSNTVPALIEALGGCSSDVVSTPQGNQLRESEYDRLFVVTLGAPEKSADRVQRRAISTLELRYGD